MTDRADNLRYFVKYRLGVCFGSLKFERFRDTGSLPKKKNNEKTKPVMDGTTASNYKWKEERRQKA